MSPERQGISSADSLSRCELSLFYTTGYNCLSVQRLPDQPPLPGTETNTDGAAKLHESPSTSRASSPVTRGTSSWSVASTSISRSPSPVVAIKSEPQTSTINHAGSSVAPSLLNDAEYEGQNSCVKKRKRSDSEGFDDESLGVTGCHQRRRESDEAEQAEALQ